MDTEETSVLRLDRNAEQQAFESRPGRARWAAVGFSIEVLAVLANTEVPMFPTRRYRGQHATQGAVHRGLLLRIERVHGAHQSFERIARNRFFAFVRQSESNASPVSLGSLSDQVATRLKHLDDL
jgi:hypothetical protein